MAPARPDGIRSACVSGSMSFRRLGHTWSDKMGGVAALVDDVADEVRRDVDGPASVLNLAPAPRTDIRSCSTAHG
jgi:hypothetical protein